MKYKMLVLDLDDTLLTDDYRISERNRKRLIEAQEKGVYVVLASGRPTPAMIRFADELELSKYGSFIISYNGAVITDLRNNQIIFEHGLTKEQIHDIYDFSIEHNVHILTYKDKQIVTETESEYIGVEQVITGMAINKVDCFKTTMDRPAIKCLLLEEPSYLKVVESRMKKAFSDLSVSISKPFFLEVVPHGIDKAASIHHLAEKLGIQQSEVIAVGNAGNDLSMIEYAGLGIWVDNVTPELRDRADVIVASNNDDGVAEVVERFILN
jgi:Cof subfamily protein (haloacid dehalogenase superfamily)